MVEHCQDKVVLYSLPLLLVLGLETRSTSLIQELLRVRLDLPDFLENL
jgi:hypothetical protein